MKTRNALAKRLISGVKEDNYTLQKDSSRLIGAKKLLCKLAPIVFLFALFTHAMAQDFIISDTKCKVSGGLLASPNGSIMLHNGSFDFQKLPSTYVPHGDIIDLEPDGSGISYFGVSYFDDNKLAIFWIKSAWVENVYYRNLYVQQYDSTGTNHTDAAILDSCQYYYSKSGIAQVPDQDNELGLAFVSNDTLFAMYFNPETSACSNKKTLLTGSGTLGIEAVDFLSNSDVRIIWRDVNRNVRHKRLAKSGEILLRESIIIDKGTLENGSGLLKYIPLSNGHFMLTAYHRKPENYEYGIKAHRFKHDAIASQEPIWICDSIGSATWSISIQDDGKAVFVWTKMKWDDILSKEIIFLHMQLLDENGHKLGSEYLPTSVNSESYKNAYGVRQGWPTVRLHNDTILLLWDNYNEEHIPMSAHYMNLQHFTLPVASSIASLPVTLLNHSVFAHPNTGELWLKIESDLFQKADIELYDISGMLLNTIPSLQLHPGHNEILLTKSLDRIMGNFTIYQIKTGNKKYSGRFIY